ncbi:hypothetical protein KEH51_25155 [[Brevibacterium] frigoritolerans]|uniref:Uncharacterized protein n=1 Tax=Peribacillus frigoritolerans TaxID=450367 RepID=A0A941FM46_9BACI|nr:hypothetical protein [Peribacillus frigoritolerans]
MLAAVVIFTVRLGFETSYTHVGNILHSRVTITDYFLVSIIPQANIQNIQPVFEGGAKPLIRAVLFMSACSRCPLLCF